MALATSFPRESFGRSAFIQASRWATSGRLCSVRAACRSMALLPPKTRSISKRASMRRTVSSASGEMTTGLSSLALVAMSASTKNLRRA
jgi:hypothetical protein